MAGRHEMHPALQMLSERERAVALCVARGESNKEITRDLNIAERTIKSHLTAIFEKLGVRDRLQLAILLNTPG
jgi:DNA-binding NarL/FixJ family response regulator